jgi:hydrogenase maturation protease
MRRMLVIGIGSVIMTDDGVGSRVAEAMQSKLQEHDMAIVVGETDVQFCLDEIQPDDILVVIDSMVQGKEPGSIEIVPLKNVLKSYSKLHSQHDFNLIDALSLNYPETEGCLIGIEASVIGFGFELSKELRSMFEQICDDVFRAILEIKEAATRA